MVDMDIEINLNFKGGGSIVSHRPFFSLDGEHIFVCWKKSILEYNRKTGKLIYEYQGLSDSIIGFSYFVFDSFPCLAACSECGKVIIWRTMTHYKILEKQIPVQGIRTFNVLVSENTEEVRAFISYISKESVCFTLVDIKKGVSKHFSISFKLNEQEYFVDIGGNEYFSVAHGSNLYFGHFNDTKNISRQVIPNTRSFTCITCHPSEEIVLTGDTSGRVVAWRNIFKNNKIQTVFHWHTLPVRAVYFSAVGSYFYSGGEECVLVKWQLDNVHDKKFLPRLPAEIQHITIAVNNLYVALATRDNAIRILDNQMDQTSLIQHLVLGKQYESGIVYDPRTKSLIMNGSQGHIQFYSPHNMSLLYSVDISGQNKITNERNCVIHNTEIRKVAVNKSGMWLATVEERRDPVYHGEIRLRFWNFNSKTQTFELNTSVEYPHDKSVKSILFQPMNNDDNLRCITLGEDKKFKIWQLAEFTTVYKKSLAWKCFAVGFFRDLNCAGLSFSVDGSLMAIGFESILTTWTPESCQLKCSLVHPSHREKIEYVKFGYSNQCHLLVSASANQLSVWNLLTLCLVWTVPVRVKFLISDPLSTHMAVITKTGKVFVFTPISPVPLFSNEDLLKKQNIIAATFVPSKYSNDAGLKWYERSHLYFINSDNELLNISSTEINLDTVDMPEKKKSLFNMMTPSSSLNLARSNEAKRQLFKKDVNQQTFKKFFEAPIHTMAPARFTCYSLLKSLVVQKDTVN